MQKISELEQERDEQNLKIKQLERERAEQDNQINLQSNQANLSSS